MIQKLVMEALMKPEAYDEEPGRIELVQTHISFVFLTRNFVYKVKKAVNLGRHLEEHPKDLHSKRGRQLAESKIYRLSKYYKQKGILPSDWKYSRERAVLMVR